MICKEAIFGNSRKYLCNCLERLMISTKILSEYAVFWSGLNHASPDYKVTDSPLPQFDLNPGFYFNFRNKIK
jgi:hypothetical protein